MEGVGELTPWMLQDIGTELAYELSILVVDLYLMGWTAFSDDDIARLTEYRHTIGIQQLTVAFATFAKLKTKSS